MNEGKNWKNIGEQIVGCVTEALNTGDFGQLNDLVGETVNSAIDEARWEFQKTCEKVKQEEIRRQQDNFNLRQAEHRSRQERIQRRREELRDTRADSLRRSSTVAKREETEPVSVQFNRVGDVSGLLYEIFGGLGIGSSIFLGIFLFLFFGIGTWLWGPLILLILFCTLVKVGVIKRERLTRAKRYIQLCKGKMYGALEDIAKSTGRSVRYIKRDIKKMIRMGMFPEGHLDMKETCFILNDYTYQQYQLAQVSFEQRESEKQSRSAKSTVSTSEEQGTEDTGNNPEAELNAMISEGMECTRKLRELNERIPGEEISNCLYRLEDLLKEIFNRVKEHPEQMQRMHKMMDYYLPTTVKLVEAYADFDKVSAPGSEIKKAKEEIEKTLGIINEAFEELLNNLFQDAAFDATADAQVLQTMLAKEGLAKNGAFGDIK